MSHATHGGRSGENRFMTAGYLDGRLIVMVARRSAPRHVDEVRPCQGNKTLEGRNGPIPMTRRN
jgi:hypothetical protein